MRRTSLVALLLSLAVFAGCGGSGSGSGSRSETTAAGWSRHHVDDGGFSLEFPTAWKTLDKLDPDALDGFFKENPQFAQYRSVLSSGLVKVVAFDPDVANGFATNANVIVHNLGSRMSLSDYADATAEQISQVTGAKPDLQFVELPAGRSVRFAYDNLNAQINGEKRRLATLQYAFVRGASEYVVTFTTLPALQARYRTTFERAARSLRFD